jgi:hypothetical protein
MLKSPSVEITVIEIPAPLGAFEGFRRCNLQRRSSEALNVIIFKRINHTIPNYYLLDPRTFGTWKREGFLAFPSWRMIDKLG